MKPTPIGQFRALNINPNHHLIRRLVELRTRDRVPRKTLAERSGHPESKIRYWEYETREPGLFAFEDALRVMGYKLAVVPEDSERDGRDTDMKHAGKWLKTTEVAKRLGITFQAVNARIKAGELRATRVGRLYLEYEGDLTEFLRAHRVRRIAKKETR